MGCDIHMHVEQKIGDQWGFVYKPVLSEFSSYIQNYYGYEGRNYDLFSVLAGVRPRNPISAIVEPRGVPVDASYLVDDIFESWGVDAHTASWLTLKEILDFDWDNQTMISGLVSLRFWKLWKEELKTSPDVWPGEFCQGASGPHTIVILEEDYLRTGFIPLNDKKYYLQCSWKSSYKHFAKEFLARVERMKELDPDPENIRIVFWFDN